MSSIVIRRARRPDGGDVARLVHRRHDLGGTDYEGLAVVDMDLARALGRAGVVVRAADAVRHGGRPGIVFGPTDEHGRVAMEIRADVADPKTTMKQIVVDRDLPGEVLCNAEVDNVTWLHGEPAADRGAE